MDKKAKAYDARSHFALVEMSVGSSVSPVYTYPASEMPLGGAMSMQEALDYQKKKAGKARVLDALQVFTMVVQNILDVPEVKDKQSLLQKALDDFSLVIAEEKLLAMLEKSGVEVANPVRDFLYPKGLGVKAAVAKSLHMQPRTESRPLSVRAAIERTT